MKLLLEIKDKDFPEDMSKVFVREAVRAVAYDEDGLLPLVYDSKNCIYKLPGGGIEKGENVKTALEREVKEEAGCTIMIEKEVGEILEFRSNYQMKQTSYCYLAKVINKGETNFTEDEINNGFKLSWMKIDDAIKQMESIKFTTYESNFMQPRDLAFLKEAKKLIYENLK